MDSELTESERLFRERLRDWLAESVPKQPRPPEGPAMREFDLEWQRIKYHGGWAGIAWPKAHGGLGLSLAEQMIWYEECARAKAPSEGALTIALTHAGPTLMDKGTDEQRAFHLGRILRGEVVWCQGFSEPGSGSDLASLQARGVIDGDHMVVTGQKIWSSYAHLGDFQELLVRTGDPQGRHKGLTWIICDMRTPGIEVRPIRTMAHNTHFAEVFYDNVRIPMSSVVGGVGEGWKVAMFTLSHERLMLSAARAAELDIVLGEMLDLARQRQTADGRCAIDDDHLAFRLASARAEVAALRAMNYQQISVAQHSGAPGFEGTVNFLYYGEVLQRVRALALDIIGADAIEVSSEAGRWTLPYLEDRRWLIAGGTAEIRRNIIAERVLGLPRERLP